jgi:uncharacterized protein YkwD
MDGRATFPTFVTVALAALAALVLAAPRASASVAPLPGCGSGAHTRAAPVPISDAAILCLVNRHRAFHHVKPLRLNASLAASARRHSAQMVTDRYFSHGGPNNSSLIRRVGATRYLRHARAWALGETLAWASASQATPTGLVNLLMASPPHRAILLDPSYRDIGVGVGAGAPVAGDSGATLTLDLGSATR